MGLFTLQLVLLFKVKCENYTNYIKIPIHTDIFLHFRLSSCIIFMILRNHKMVYNYEEEFPDDHLEKYGHPGILPGTAGC